MYNNITSNQVRIWDSRERNMDFHPIFTANWGLSVKTNTNQFGF
jgi:hypothetical protein